MFYAAIGLNALVVAMLGWSWLRRRRVFVLPSTWVLLLSALFYMLPALILTKAIAEMSPYTWTAMAYCASFVGGGLLINMMLPLPRWAAKPWIARGRTRPEENQRLGRYLLGILSVLAVVTAWYLAYVPIGATGLYGLLFDPDHYAQLREESLKLIDNVVLQYAYLIGFSCLAPLAFTSLLERIATLDVLRGAILVTAVMLFLCFYLLLTGARVGLINLVAAGLIYGLVSNRMRIGWRSLAVGVGLIWLIPVVLSMLREQGRSEASVIEYMAAIGDRIFLLPLLISGWFVEYAETRGYAGIMAALGIGSQPDWTNAIALEFLERKDDVTLESVTTPTAFFFSNYLYFGWFGLLPSIAALKLLDVPVRYLGRLPGAMIRPFLATSLYFALIFVRAGFGVTLVSHGYLILAGLILLVGARAPQRNRVAAAHPAGP